MIEAKKANKKQPKPNNKTSGKMLVHPILDQGNDLSKTQHDGSKDKPAISKYLRFLRPRDFAQVITNALLVVIAFFTWRVYEMQLNTTQTAERAWLRVDLGNQAKESEAEVIVDPNQPLSARLSVTNIGKTAAKGIYVDACVEILSNDRPVQANWTSALSRTDPGMLSKSAPPCL